MKFGLLQIFQNHLSAIPDAFDEAANGMRLFAERVMPAMRK